MAEGRRCAEFVMLLEIFVAPDGCPSCGRAETMVQKVVQDYRP